VYQLRPRIRPLDRMAKNYIFPHLHSPIINEAQAILASEPPVYKRQSCLHSAFCQNIDTLSRKNDNKVACSTVYLQKRKFGLQFYFLYRFMFFSPAISIHWMLISWSEFLSRYTRGVFCIFELKLFPSTGIETLFIAWTIEIGLVLYSKQTILCLLYLVGICIIISC